MREIGGKKEVGKERKEGEKDVERKEQEKKEKRGIQAQKHTC